MRAAGSAQRHLTYRPEIDGLRAIAVAGVILYHAGFAWIPGGFLGVDIFFVVSGYLISANIRKDLDTSDFSFRRFYLRRVRRILPALLAISLACIPFAWWLMLPDGLENFGQSLVATALFANNILLTATSGYFDTETAFKPLAHSWSLGVEEQFYLAAPILLWLAWRVGRARGVMLATGLVTVFSLVLCLLLARTYPAHNFFLLPTRAWELGVGALAAFATPAIRARIAERARPLPAAVGLAAACVPLFLFDAAMALPAAAMLIPVLGTATVLVLAHQGNWLGRTLGARPLAAVGLISFSLYLIHFPVFAFVRIASLDPPSPLLLGALIVPILLLSWASWAWIEQPFRDPARVSTRSLVIATGGATVLAVAIGLVFHATSGFYRNWPELGRDDPGSVNHANIAYNLEPERYLGATLSERRGARARVLVLGDSFARDVVNMGLAAGVLDPAATRLTRIRACHDRVGRQLRGVLARAELIILARRSQPGDVACIARLAGLLQANSSAPVVIVGPKSFGWNNDAVMRLAPAVRYAYRAAPDAQVRAADAALKRSLPPGHYVSILGLIGDAQGRVPVFTPDRKFISQDRMHLTRAGAAWLGPQLFAQPELAGALR
ncbi:acyltransferase [Sphingomonas sp. HF-S3]|uniref:Acyltransferase n=1 Tax=Sphingomonas rustica TaxID=3103142 RepID=A0ABV0B4F8_9SPHN